jgi:hypothetical protein
MLAEVTGWIFSLPILLAFILFTSKNLDLVLGDTGKSCSDKDAAFSDWVVLVDASIGDIITTGVSKVSSERDCVVKHEASTESLALTATSWYLTF